jgi:hypothetical protein
MSTLLVLKSQPVFGNYQWQFQDWLEELAKVGYHQRNPVFNRPGWYH